jgi:tRNA A37 threonylcarbamoyladenosine dehydratase
MRFTRTKLLIGQEGLDALARTSVIIFGLGGVGSYVAEALARAGVGRFRLVDYDVVDISNINRQIIALDSTVGKPKAKVLAARLREINPDAALEPRVEFYTIEKGEELLSGGFDWVVDAIDTTTGKLDVISRCLANGQQVISSMGAGNKLDASKLRVDDISRTSICPLARIVRKELGKRGIRRGVSVVWSPECPLVPREQLTHASRRQLPGSISYVPATAGLLIASHVVNKILQVK